MMSKLLNLITGIAALSVVACNPYNPNLPDEPFRCGTDEPRCPDGYKCDERSPIEHVCIPENAAPGPRPDASIRDAPFACNDDGFGEPNDTIEEAYPTPIPATQDEWTEVDWAICPAADVDLFSFRIDQNGKDVVAEIEFNSSRAVLQIDLLISTGALLSAGAQVEGEPNKARVGVNDMAADLYYVRVSSPDTVDNNYAISIVTSGP